DPRQRASTCAGRDDHVLGLDHALLALVRDLDLVRLPRSAAWEELRGALDVRDLVLAEQEADALADLVGDVAAALDDRREIGAHALDDDTELAGALRVLEDLGALEQRLGRDAAPVETDPTELCALDACGLQLELRGADRGDVAAGSRADHD